MSKGHKHPDRKGRRVSVHVDHLADVVIQRVAEREGLNYSMALCAMVLNAALPDKELQELLKKELAEVVVDRPCQSYRSFSKRNWRRWWWRSSDGLVSRLEQGYSKGTGDGRASASADVELRHSKLKEGRKTMNRIRKAQEKQSPPRPHDKIKGGN